MPIMGNIGNILYVFVAFVGGTLIITGTVSSVQAAFDAVSDYMRNTLGYEVCAITKT